eukprot:7073426-Prymnesium_polylepis.1
MQEGVCGRHAGRAAGAARARVRARVAAVCADERSCFSACDEAVRTRCVSAVSRSSADASAALEQGSVPRE